MTERLPPAVTELLKQWSERSPEVESELFDVVYARLLEIAAHLLRRERIGHTLDPAALVNEAFLRLVRQRRVSWRSRGHFFSIAATTMRRVLSDHGRRRGATKRGGGQLRVAFDEASLSTAIPDAAAGAMGDLLEQMHKDAPELAAIVELRFFGGLSLDETARALRRSRTAVVADWAVARDWLMQHHDA